MSIEKVIEGLTYARNAGADLSAKLYFLAHVDTDGDIVLAGAGEHCIGTIIESAAANAPVTIQTGGIAKVVLGGTVASGARAASDGSGKAVTAAAGDFEIGTILVGGDADEIVPMLIFPGRTHA